MASSVAKRRTVRKADKSQGIGASSRDTGTAVWRAGEGRGSTWPDAEGRRGHRSGGKVTLAKGARGSPLNLMSVQVPGGRQCCGMVHLEGVHLPRRIHQPRISVQSVKTRDTDGAKGRARTLRSPWRVVDGRREDGARAACGRGGAGDPDGAGG